MTSGSDHPQEGRSPRSALRGASKWLLYFLYRVKIQKQDTSIEPESGPWPKIQPASALLLDFWPPKLQEINFCHLQITQFVPFCYNIFVIAKVGLVTWCPNFVASEAYKIWNVLLPDSYENWCVQVWDHDAEVFYLQGNLPLGPSLLLYFEACFRVAQLVSL